jgi:hypothetical protein
MVGNKTRNRYFCGLNPSIRCVPKCRGIFKEGVGVSECRYFSLEGKPLADDADAKDKAAAEAVTASGLHDSFRGCEIPVARKEDYTLSPLLPDWVVHWLAQERDNGPKVVDGGSGIGRDAEEGT